MAAKKSELSSFENKLTGHFDSIKGKKKELEAAFNSEINNATKSVKADLERESIARQESIELLKELLDVIYLR